MAVTLKVRSGKAFKREIYFWDATHENLINTTGFTARVQVRGNQVPRRVLLSSSEYNEDDSPPAGTILFRVEPGHWRLFLGSSITRSLPPRVSIEVELTNDANLEDVSPLFEASLMVEPEVVANV